ncbi:MAG: hypothetical protein FWF15_11595, partial [Oscillospiraceae bacterium]|nr:hypothetical protein [Oscillospiraceae bacterium]
VVSSTFGGEALSIAASIKTIEIYRRDNVINHFWEMGKYLWDNANQMFEKYKLPIKVVGNYPCPSFTGDMVGAFISKAYEFGVSLYGVSYINFSHKKADVDMVLEAFEKTCGAL